MTKLVHSFAELGEVLLLNNLHALVKAEQAMEAAAKLIQEDAKNRIGEYQDAKGPFQAWAPLAESTEAEKARLGYPSNAPLLRDGELRDSIVTEHNATEAVIGSKSPVARYQEFGTDKIPPRPFLGPAAFQNKKKIKKLIGVAVVSALANGVIPPGYDMDIT